MADFGKLNFAVAFVPQTAFPLDGRTYFESLEAAQAAAATAVPVGSSDGVYHYGMKIIGFGIMSFSTLILMFYFILQI